MKKVFVWIKTHKFFTLIIVLALVGGGFFFYRRSTKTNGYQTATVEVRDLQKTLEISGYVDALEKVDLHFAAPTKLSWLGVKEGNSVKKWQAIASADTQSLKMQLQQSLNNFDKAFRTHDQVLDDNNYFGNPDIDRELRRILENAQYDLNNSVITVELSQLAIKLSSLVSPIAGVVTKIDQPVAGINIGVTDVFQIVNPDSLYFLAVVDETDVAALSANQSADIILDAFPDETLKSTITAVDFAAKVSESGSTIFEVTLTLPQNQVNYRLGLGGDAYVVVAEKAGVIAVPVEAVLVDEDGASVEVLVDGQTETRAVELGLETDDWAEITGGLSAGEVVVTGKN